MPTVSVILPVFNRAHCVHEALRSILYQTVAPTEVIVVDDGSTDDLRAALAPFRGKIQVLRQENQGVSAARNAGVRAASAEWVAFLDSDDLWTPNRLRILQDDLSRAGPDILCHIGNALYQTSTQNRLLFDLKPKRLVRLGQGCLAAPLGLVISGMTTQCAAVRRQALLAHGGFDEEMRFFEDTDLFCRLATSGPFMTQSAVMAVIRRLPDAGQALTDIEDTDPVKALNAQIRTLRKLLAIDLGRDDLDLVRRKLSGAYFRKAGLVDGDQRHELLSRAACLHPNPVKGILKSMIGRFSGDWGLGVALRDPKRLDRKARA